MNKIIHKSNAFVLSEIRHRKQKGGSPMYKIGIVSRSEDHKFKTEALEQIRDIVDPNRNIGGRQGESWKYRDFTTAEKLYTMLLLRFS